MNQRADKVYFPGLNGLRFLAASAVVITHVELLKGQIGLQNHWENPVIFNLGGLGVYFFFVLSGFLITYLLLAEKERYKTISVRSFYLRRVFRIWPVYYLVVFLAFFIFPHFPFLHLDWFQRFLPQHFWIKFLLYLLLLPNLALAFFPSVPHAGQTWSIGVEEQFYLVWPWIVRKADRLFRLVILIGIGIVAFKILFLLFANRYPDNYVIQSLKAFIAMTKIECMTIGAAGACIVFEKRQKLMNAIFHPAVQIICYLSIPAMIFWLPQSLNDGQHLLYSFVFAAIILNVAVNPRSLLKMENRIFNFLGNISYGMYMYHMFLVVLVVRLGILWKIPAESPAGMCYNYGGSFLLTILLSSLSYYIYEGPFMKLKSRFVRVASGNESSLQS